MKKILLCAILAIFSITVQAQQNKCVSGDCGNGFGVCEFQNGDKYEGEFVNYHLHGFGKYTDAMGNVYTGDFKDDKFNGVGKFVRTDGTWYIGEFLNGKRHGSGTQWYSKTFKDKGKWENDRFIADAEFEDFVVSDGYDFCASFQKILKSSANGFAAVKGAQISEYIKGSYYCTEKVKELTAVEINETEGYKGTWFKGDKTEGLKKLEELNKQIEKCTQSGCCSYKADFKNGVDVKYWEYSPVTVNSSCDQNLLKVKIKAVYTVKGTGCEVVLIISNP